MNRLDRIAAVVLATMAGCTATALAMLVIAKGLHIGGIGLPYVLLTIVVGVLTYPRLVRLMSRLRWARVPVLIAVPIGIICLSIWISPVWFLLLVVMVLTAPFVWTSGSAEMGSGDGSRDAKPK